MRNAVLYINGVPQRQDFIRRDPHAYDGIDPLFDWQKNGWITRVALSAPRQRSRHTTIGDRWWSPPSIYS